MAFIAVVSAGGLTLAAQRAGQQPAGRAGGAEPAARGARPTEPARTRKGEVGWRLAAEDQKYAAINGDHLKTYVDELTAIARRYRDNGHPQFWGRIIGTEADAENARWLMDKFKQIGLSDVRDQSFDLPPQWMPQSWSVVASGHGKTLNLDTAQPTYQAVGTSAEGLDLEAAWV